MRSFLSQDGQYVGLDIIQFAINWCRRNIARKSPNFLFVHADLLNQTYNSAGRLSPDTYTFPFADESFSFVVATSLFTHLLPSATERYFHEVSRVLKPDGRFLASWFLLTEGELVPSFPHRFEHHAQRSLHAPEQAVAYRVDYIRSKLACAGFLVDKVAFGGWSGRSPDIDSGQDVIVARKLNGNT